MSSVYHEGELQVQKMSGVEIVAEQNGRGVRPDIAKGIGNFLRTQSIIILSSVDEYGRVWSSFLNGDPGFINVLDEITIKINCNPVTNDPLIANLATNPEIGMLAIDFGKRIRVRINGKGFLDPHGGIVVVTEQVYGNCPKYIQKRTLLADDSSARIQKSVHRRISLSLSPEQQDWIRRADTFFIGSRSPAGQMDVSHRGGPTGFIHVADEKRILFPDYFGNSMYNTLGNIYSNPKCGLLFIDFDGGHSLQLTGQSEIIWDEDEISKFPRAEKVVQFDIDEVLYIENGTPLSWDFIEFSPANPTI